jgi:sulfur carrier protein
VITITVNGVATVVADDLSLGALLDTRDTPPKGVAVALNFEVIRRTDWSHTQLHEGAVVEIVTAAAGG